MYKLLLCWRYLRTRYIALVCIISVTLGVATMIVVNSVMAGFTHEMNARLNGMLGDLVVEAISQDGAPDAEARMKQIKAIAGDDIVGMSPTVHAIGMLYVEVNGQPHARQITLVGVDEATHASVSDFGKFLQHPANREHLTFNLHENGYDAVDHQTDDMVKTKPREQLRNAGAGYRRYKARVKAEYAAAQKAAAEAQAGTAAPSDEPAIADPFSQRTAAAQPAAPPEELGAQQTGIVLGLGVLGFRAPDGSDYFLAVPGDDVQVSFLQATVPPKLLSSGYTIVDFYESKMSEYDSSFAFVPIRSLQKSRGMIDPVTGVAFFNTIQVKLRPGADADAVRDRIQHALPSHEFIVSTWRDKQGPLLAAVQMETAVLNVLLFMIIAVAGFGILAIFYMIVVEKTRDIGILKSLGASGRGVMGIFLGYGLSLGLVGAGAGAALGLAFVAYINEIADALGKVTGQPVFDPSVYYFAKIPTIVEPLTVAWIAAGAIAIAILASVLPARRAARLHPVSALRYE